MAVSYLSLDPAMRGWMNASASYIEPVEIGAVMRAGAVGRVIASEHPASRSAITCTARSGCRSSPSPTAGRDQDRSARSRRCRPISARLGSTGLTAYFGLLDVGRLQEGDTVVVSGAAGAVGSVAGQIAKIKGARVIGIAGGAEKCRWIVDELGFDAAIDYKAEDVRRALREHAPAGVDVFFDNVGGEILDAVLTRLARGARIVICGGISQYNANRRAARPTTWR